MQKPISSTLRGAVCKEHKNASGSSFLSAKMCKTYENAGETLAVTLYDIHRSPKKN